MPNRFSAARRLIFGCLVVVIQAATAADMTTTCQTTGWDTSRELQAFGRKPLRAAAGGVGSEMPSLRVGTLYALRLRAQNNVVFVQPPGRADTAPASMAGLVQFAVATSGLYRITIDSPLWMDVVTSAGITAPSAYTGWHECSVFRKSVDYTLEAGQAVTLQFSNAATDLVKVTIEPPPRL